MHAVELVETVRSEHETALSRLGSSKSVFAETDGELEPETVLASAARNAHHAADILESWAGAGGQFADVFAEGADALGDQAEAIAGRLEAFEPGADPAVLADLRDLDGDVERAGALLGWTLVRDQKATQLTGYFTGQADPQTASDFRAYGTDYEDLQDALEEALDDRCQDADSWDRARTAAAATVEAAYEDYVETLESLGVNPKPVC